MAKAPVVKNILEIRGTLPAKALIHFTASQWKALTGRMVVSRIRPKYGVGLAGYPIPGGDILAQPVCIENPCEICRAPRSGFGRDGIMTLECVCRPDRERCPQDPPPPPSSPLCVLRIRRTGARIGLTCDSQGCTRSCRVGVVQDQGRWLISCLCR